MEDESLPKIGDPISDPPPPVFELVIYDHIDFVHQKNYNLPDHVGIDPRDYFVTSGDAVEKAKYLDKALWRHAGALRSELFNLMIGEHKCDMVTAQKLVRSGKRPKHPANFADYEAACWRAAGKSRKMVAALMLAKGSNCFLETEWDSHKLLCIPKNPRR